MTVTFNANGGTVDPIKEQYTYGDKYLDLPQPRRTGCDFAGWCDKNGEKCDETVTILTENDHVLTACWNATVTFIDTVNNSTIEQIVNIEEKLELRPLTSSSNYTFVGWKNTETGDKYICQNNEIWVDVTKHTTFEAIWECDVTYAPDGGTGAPNDSTVERGSSYTVGDAPKKQGYYFRGWKSSFGEGQIYLPGDKVTILQHTEFTALWDEMRVYITYEGEGTEHMSPQMITYSDLELDEDTATTDKLMIPTSLLQGIGVGWWNLRGWKMKSDHSENPMLYTNYDGKSLPFINQTLVSVVDPVVRPRGMLTFDANGGYGAPKEQLIYFDEVNIIPKEIPTHPSGMRFLSWYDVSPEADYNLKPVYSTGEAFERKYNATLQAQWSHSFIIRYDSGIWADASDPVYNLPLPITFELIDQNGKLFEPVIYSPTEMPTRKGYTAVGWAYTDLNGDLQVISPGERIDVLGALPLYAVTGPETIVVHAVWQEIPRRFVTVKFRDLYNDDPIETRQVAVGGTYGTAYNTGKAVDTVFPIVGERNGSAFVGWTLDGVLIDEDTVVTKTEEHTLTPLFCYLSYEDLNENYNWAASSIYLCGYYGYMTGTSDTLFSPGKEVERGHAVIALYRMAGQPMMGNNQYWDIPGVPTDDDGTNDTYEKLLTHAITWADNCGIAKGMTEDRFEPLEKATRLQMALFLSRYAKLYMPTLEKGKTPIAEDAELEALEKDNAEAYAAVTWAASHGILTASEDSSVNPPKTTYELGSKVTRAQLAVVLIRLRDVLERYKHEQVSGAQHPADDDSECLDELIGDFASNSWESISKASAAGVASLCWHVGDEKDITLSNGEVVTVQIYGFDHDDLSNGGKAGITLGLKNVMRSARRMDINATNADSFVGTELYRWLNGTLFEMLPDDLRAVIRAVDKKTSCGGSSTEYRTDSMKLFLFSESECFGRTHYSHGEEGEQYPIFTNDASRIKVLKGPEIYEWWERSPMSAYNSSFCLVHATGHAGYTSATTGYIGVAFGFCI